MAPFVGRVIRHITDTILLRVMMILVACVISQPAFAAPYAAIVMDARSGEVLFERNADTRLHPASLTKMMTLYITFQELEAGRLSLDTTVTVSKNAASQPPSRLGLRAGQKIQVRYLIRAAALKSANDAAAALGDHIGGSEAGFGKRMTRTAKALGMRNSTFHNAHGLTRDGHLSTARDMTILGRHLFYDFPQYYNIFSRRTADAGIAQVRTTNSRFLDNYEGADGIKTGYTVAAGFNLTASAKRGDKRIIATVFGGASTAARNAKMVELLNIGFGAAKNRVQEKRPVAAPLIASEPVARPPKTEPLVEPGAIDALIAQVVAQPAPPVGVTTRQSGAVSKSLRPQYRPAADAPVQLAEAPAEEIPFSTAIAEEIEETVAIAVETPPPAPNSFEAQALALAANKDAPPPAAEPEVTATQRPMARPENLTVAKTEQPAEPPAPAQTLEALNETAAMLAAALETPRPVAPTQAVAQADNDKVAAPVKQEVQVAAVTPKTAVPPTEEPAVPTRRAPIFDPVVIAEAEPEAQSPEELVVVSKSSSNSRAWSVSVGAYRSHYEAERALLKTGLAESSTLEQGLRKVTQKGNAYRASFMGLTQDQADLACRRLRARGQTCETDGPG